MGSSIYNIGVTGLAAAQAGLLTTGHNISNATTPGYNRQQVIQSTNTPQFTGAGFLGQGTNVVTVQRIYNQFLAAQSMTAQTRLAEVSAYADQVRQVDSLLADASAGLSSALDSFFGSMNAVAASPASVPARQSLLATSQALVGRFQSVDSRLNEIRDGVDTQLASTIDDINSYATQIAELNQRVILAQAAGPLQPANDLHDQREQLLAKLNESVRVTTVRENDGSVNIFIGNGQALVVGTQTFRLAATADAADLARMTVGVVQAGGGISPLSESLLTGGRLGGLLSFRSESLDAAQNALGRIAVGLAMSFNNQHRLGQDLSGALGTNYFVVPPATVLANAGNAGSGVLTAAASDASALTASDYTLSYSAANTFTLRRLADGQTWSGTGASQAAAFANLLGNVTPAQGFTLSWAGAAVVGDAFTLQPTRNAATGIGLAITDARAIAAAAPIRTAANNANSGTGAISAGSVNGPPPTNVNLTQTVTITFDDPPGTFDVAGVGTGNPANVAFTAGGNISYNGWTVKISGTPAAGDVFTLSANSAGVSDSRNALLLAGLQTQKTLSGGSASYQSSYAQIVSDVGNKTREVEVTVTAQASILKQAQDAQQSVSGVNLDEEAANLLRYQQAYQASGKMIEIASKLFDTLLTLGR